jgi:hypothetical protein
MVGASMVDLSPSLASVDVVVRWSAGRPGVVMCEVHRVCARPQHMKLDDARDGMGYAAVHRKYSAERRPPRRPPTTPRHEPGGTPRQVNRAVAGISATPLPDAVHDSPRHRIAGAAKCIPALRTERAAERPTVRSVPTARTGSAASATTALRRLEREAEAPPRCVGGLGQSCSGDQRRCAGRPAAAIDSPRTMISGPRTAHRIVPVIELAPRCSRVPAG